VRRDVADGAVQAGVVVPVDPFHGFPFDLINGLPEAEELDDRGVEQADDAFGEVVVVGIPDGRRGSAIDPSDDGGDRGIDAGLTEPLGVSDRQVSGGFNRSSAGFANSRTRVSVNPGQRFR